MPVIEEIVREGLLLEHVVVVGQLARQERVGVPPPLHRDVAVDGEALRRGAPLGLQQRRQELQREVDHVGRPRRADHPIEIGEIAGAPLGGEEAQQAERSGLDLIEPRQHAALVLEEALQEPQHPGGIVRARQRVAIELVDRRGRGELVGGGAAGDPAQVDVTEQARQDHRQHLVLERRRRQLGDRVGPRHPRQQRLVARQLGCAWPSRPAPSCRICRAAPSRPPESTSPKSWTTTSGIRRPRRPSRFHHPAAVMASAGTAGVSCE